MARIPQPGARAIPQDRSSVVRTDTSSVGSGLRAIGKLGEQVVNEYQVREDEAAVNEFRKKLNDWENTNVFDPVTGAVSKRGENAFGLPQQIPQDLDKFLETEGSGTFSPRAQQAIAGIAQSRRDQLSDWANRHAGQQRELYFNEQFEANNATSIRRAASLADDQGMVEAELRQLRERTVGFYRTRGAAPETVVANMQAEEQKFHGGVMADLLSRDDYVKGSNYFNLYADRLSTEAMVRSREQLRSMGDKRDILSGVDEIVKTAGPTANFNSDPLPNIEAVVLQLESGGRRWSNEPGKLLTSPKGAKGEMQVMDATATDPGYGVRPAQDSSPEELARVGRDYINAMVREYRGDTDKAMAAYNAGPGAVGNAVLKAQKQGGDWLSYLPQETQDYVRKGSGMLSKVESKPIKPSRAEYDEMLRERFGDNPEKLQAARAELDLRVRMEEASIKQSRDDAKEKAILAIDGGMPVDSIPRDIRSRLDPTDLPGLRTYAKAIINRTDVPTDMGLYYDLVTDPRRLKEEKTLMIYKDRLGEQEFKELTRMKATLENPTKWNSILTRKETAQRMMESMGVSEKNAKKKIGEFMFEMAKRTNDDTNEKDYEATAARLLTEISLNNRAWFNSSKRVYELDPAKDFDRAIVTVPDGDRQRIIASLNRQGIPPNEAAIKRYYLLGQMQ